MALFKGKGENLSRAVGILSQITPNEANAHILPEPVDPTAADLKPIEPAAVDPTPHDPKPADPQDPKPADPPVNEPDNKDKPADPEPVAQPEPTPADPKPIEPEKLPAPEITEEAIFAYLGEKLNRKVESLDDLTIREQQELDPEIQQIVEWKEKTGLSLSKWSEYNRDFKKMNDLEVAREIRAQKYPNLNQEELNYTLKDFIFDENEDEEVDRIKKSIALKQFAADGRRELEKNQLNLVSSEGSALTEQQKQDLALVDQVKQNQQNAEVQRAKYLQDIGKAAKSLKGINMKLSDDIDIQYDISDSIREKLPKLVTDMPHWYNEDGSMKHDSIVKDALIIRDYPKMLKKAYEQGLSAGTEAKIKKDKNITIDPGHKPSEGSEGKKKGNINDVVDKITGGPSKTGKLRFGKMN